MRKIKFIIPLFFALMLACSESATSSNSYSAPSVETADKSPLITEKLGSGGGGNRNEEPSALKISLNQAENAQNALTTTERKIIRNADLQLETDAPEDAQNKITQIAESKGGFVVETQSSASDQKATTRDTVTMTVRVPAARFNESLDEIRKTASRVVVETVKGQDVTEEFIDIEAQLKTKKALEEQFLEIMKRSNSVADALDVQRELANVRGEIERIEGRKKFLENQASLSTIKIRLQTPTAFAGNSKGFFRRLGEAFGSGFDAALTFVLFFVSAAIAVLPFLLLVVLPIYLLLRYFLKRYRRRKSAVEIAREEIKTE